MIDAVALCDAVAKLQDQLAQLHRIVQHQSGRIATLEGLVAAVPAYKYQMSPFGGFDVIC